jgi:hypothetical protein
MENRLETSNGFYSPSFFKLVVEGDCDLGNLNNLERHKLSTFFHEYIHFVQDITTSYGLLNASIVANRLRYYTNEFRNSSSNTVAVPIPKSGIANVKDHYELQNIYLGVGVTSHSNKKPIITGVSYENTTIIHPVSKKFIKEIVVNFTSAETNYFFRFGALCLLENMAHIMQSKFFPEVDHPDLPYRGAELVANHIYPDFAKDKFKVFALCDACLMTIHPGEMFYNVLCRMQSERWDEGPFEVYNYVYNYHKELFSVEIESIFKLHSAQASKLIQSYFTTQVFYEEKKWISVLLSEAKFIRLNKHHFLLDILIAPSFPNQEFIKLFECIGSPLMMNGNSEAWFFPPTKYPSRFIQPDRLSAIKEIFNLFEFGSKKCDLKSHCLNSHEVDMRCRIEPWSRHTDAKLCAYGRLWKTWELFNRSPL